MSHDITLDSFARHRGKGYAKVRRLQGRMFTDADFNEQVDVGDRRLRDFVGDLLGATHAGPANNLGFAVTVVTGGQPPAIEDLQIGVGRYYVDGVCVENPPGQPAPTSYVKQTGVEKAPDLSLITDRAKQALLVYLDVRSVPVTPLDDPELLDVGFGGRDSSDRERWDWTVRVGRVQKVKKEFEAIDSVDDVLLLQADGTVIAFGQLAFALTAPEDAGAESCVIMPEEAYTGPENQLYRVEVHRTGKVASDDKVAPDADTAPRFKWSRDNAAPAFAITAAERDASEKGAKDWPVWTVTLASFDALGGLRSLERHHWVEVYRPEWYRYDKPLPLLWVKDVDPDRKVVTLTLGHVPKSPVSQDVKKAIKDATDAVDEALVRPGESVPKGRLVLWDHEGGDFTGLPYEEDVRSAPPKTGDPAVPGIHLEHGVLAKLQPGKYYRAGDYWLYPARTSAQKGREADFLGPSGPEHVYAPLAILFLKDNTATTATPIDRRKKFGKLASDVVPPPATSPDTGAEAEHGS
jgi:hypothetical protein